MAETVTKDFKEKKEFLESYRRITAEAELLREELKDWQELSTAHPKEGLYAANIVLKRAEVLSREDDALEVKIKILEATDRIADKRIRNILRRHYIHGQSIKKIAKVMYYSERYVKRLHKKGIETLSIEK